MAVLSYVIAAAGGLIGGTLGVVLPFTVSKKAGFTVASVLEKKNDKIEDETQTDEEGNPIKATEIKSEPIFHVVEEEKPKSPFKAGPKKKAEEKNVNGVETVNPEN